MWSIPSTLHLEIKMWVQWSAIYNECNCTMYDWKGQTVFLTLQKILVSIGNPILTSKWIMYLSNLFVKCWPSQKKHYFPVQRNTWNRVTESATSRGIFWLLWRSLKVKNRTFSCKVGRILVPMKKVIACNPYFLERYLLTRFISCTVIQVSFMNSFLWYWLG